MLTLIADTEPLLFLAVSSSSSQGRTSSFILLHCSRPGVETLYQQPSFKLTMRF